jgi:hypothetical protein
VKRNETKRTSQCHKGPIEIVIFCQEPLYFIWILLYHFTIDELEISELKNSYFIGQICVRSSAELYSRMRAMLSWYFPIDLGSVLAYFLQRKYIELYFELMS